VPFPSIKAIVGRETEKGIGRPSRFRILFRSRSIRVTLLPALEDAGASQTGSQSRTEGRRLQMRCRASRQIREERIREERRLAPRLRIELPLEGVPSIELDAESAEDEARLLAWLLRSRELRQLGLSIFAALAEFERRAA
jgi:hypothetical protein